MITSPSEQQINQAYELAKERYAALDVDTDAALATLTQTPISLHCWQGDDVVGFEDPRHAASAAASWLPAIIPAKRDPPMSYAVTWIWPTASFPEPTASICT